MSQGNGTFETEKPHHLYSMDEWMLAPLTHERSRKLGMPLEQAARELYQMTQYPFASSAAEKMKEELAALKKTVSISSSNGGPAYPMPASNWSEGDKKTHFVRPWDGKSLRDDFAGLAMHAFLRDPKNSNPMPHDIASIAKTAYDMAQAMIAEKNAMEASDGQRVRS